MTNLLKEVPDLVDQRDRALIDDKLTCQMSNFPENAEMISWAGIGFGEDTNFLI